MDTLTKPQTTLRVELRHDQAKAPHKANPTDACFDLYSPIATTIPAWQTAAVDMGFGMQLEAGWEAQIRGRSGLAKRGIVAHPGTIDHLYRQNLHVLIHNLSGHDYEIEVGDRVAQMTLAQVPSVTVELGSIAATRRGGFGSTGR